MKNYPAHRLTVIALVCTATVLLWAGVDVAGAQAGDIDEVASPNGVAPKLELTPRSGARSTKPSPRTRAKWRRAGFRPLSGARCRR